MNRGLSGVVGGNGGGPRKGAETNGRCQEGEEGETAASVNQE